MDTFPLRLNDCFADPAQSSHGTMLLELLVIRTDEEVCTRFWTWTISRGSSARHALANDCVNGLRSHYIQSMRKKLVCLTVSGRLIKYWGNSRSVSHFWTTYTYPSQLYALLDTRWSMISRFPAGDSLLLIHSWQELSHEVWKVKWPVSGALKKDLNLWP